MIVVFSSTYLSDSRMSVKSTARVVEPGIDRWVVPKHQFVQRAQ